MDNLDVPFPVVSDSQQTANLEALAAWATKVTAAMPSTLGDSAAATTPGSVVKSIEVFDSAGNSVGFLPVYDAIT